MKTLTKFGLGLGAVAAAALLAHPAFAQAAEAAAA
jgi:hypothetical protein